MHKPVALVLFLLWTNAYSEVLKCPQGLQPAGSRCVTQPMADYISCIEATGGNKQEIQNEIASVVGTNKSGGAKAEGSAKVVKGTASIVLDNRTEDKIVRKLEAKWYPLNESACANAFTLQRKSYDANRLAAPKAYQERSSDIALPASKKLSLNGHWSIPRLRAKISLHIMSQVGDELPKVGIDVIGQDFSMTNAVLKLGQSTTFQVNNDMFILSIDEIHIEQKYVVISIKKA